MTGRRRVDDPNGSLFDEVLAAPPPAFALLHRPDATGPAALDVLVGEVSLPDTLDDIPLSDGPGSDRASRHESLVLIPHRQIGERGFIHVNDGAPLIAMTVDGQELVPVAEVLARIPDTSTQLSGARFDVEDADYAEVVRRVLAEEIGRGSGANFVIKRSFVADIAGYTVDHALAFFRRLLERESGAYWTFLVHVGGRTFVGATPERHISLRNGVAVMNPISGTYRYPDSGPTLTGVLDFLADGKEIDELYMVVDEELKMMARICQSGARVVGPYLKEMTRLAHTEYLIEGRCERDPREILRETMFAPTVIGSPLESACRVISQYEPDGRGFYGGAVALIGRDERGGRLLDSAILIRTADIDRSGRVQVGVGATLVRHSDPASEVAETRVKAAGLISALESAEATRFGAHPLVRAALQRRNAGIADFWLSERRTQVPQEPALTGRQVLIIDAEDNFTWMIGHQLQAMGLVVTVRRFDDPYSFAGSDLVVIGPGPGDPRDAHQPKIANLRSVVRSLLTQRQPFIAVCLGHHVLSGHLGLDLVRRTVPNQGVQKEIDLFGVRHRVGFYNTFAAHSQEDKIDALGVGVVEVSRDRDTGEVHALRGPGFASIQFHPESVLTQDGPGIVASLLGALLPG
ncbi:MAG TPA: anthranilate synthase family protein [Micromonosporaceae bacterium]|nr:anthranilate synthase family protein [Micromonosporaceae bacterium]